MSQSISIWDGEIPVPGSNGPYAVRIVPSRPNPYHYLEPQCYDKTIGIFAEGWASSSPRMASPFIVFNHTTKQESDERNNDPHILNAGFTNPFAQLLEARTGLVPSGRCRDVCYNTPYAVEVEFTEIHPHLFGVSYSPGKNIHTIGDDVRLSTHSIELPAVNDYQRAHQNDPDGSQYLSSAHLFDSCWESKEQSHRSMNLAVINQDYQGETFLIVYFNLSPEDPCQNSRIFYLNRYGAALLNQQPDGQFLVIGASEDVGYYGYYNPGQSHLPGQLINLGAPEESHPPGKSGTWFPEELDIQDTVGEKRMRQFLAQVSDNFAAMQKYPYCSNRDGQPVLGRLGNNNLPAPEQPGLLGQYRL